MYIFIVGVYGSYINVNCWCIWVLYACILIVYMEVIYIYVDCVYVCYIHVY